MSQPPTAKPETKRTRADEAAGAAGGAEAVERSVRQRRGPSSAAAAAPAAHAAPAASSSSSSSSAAPSAPTVTRPSLMRLAVVERQLIMQALDITSLSRLASTCKQLRAEALHRQAGRYLCSSPAIRSAWIDLPPPGHASPLFRAHMPMGLRIDNGLKTADALDPLLDKAAAFARITTLVAWNRPWWAQKRALRVLSLPSMRGVTTVDLTRGSQWIKCSRVQTALCRLPQLASLSMTAGPSSSLLPSAVGLASKLSRLSVTVRKDHAASVGSLRALSLAPALTSLSFDFDLSCSDPPVAELVRCLPPTLTQLTLEHIIVDPDVPRPLIKALFSRTPLLQSVHISGSIETVLRGLMDAGLRALPLLRRVHLTWVTPVDFLLLDEDADVEEPDPIRPLLRRFLHRFPEVSVRLDLHEEDWSEPEQLSDVQLRYAGWPRVELQWAEPDDGMEAPPSLHAPDGGASGRPPSPHASDDEDGSDVEEWLDPLAAEAHSNQSAN